VKFAFVAAQRNYWPVTVQCRLLEVSTSGFYQWLRRKPGLRAEANAQLQLEIRRVLRESRGCYGSPRVHHQLRAEGLVCSQGRVARLMRQLQLRGRRPQRFVVTTQSGGAFQAADNLLARRFAPDGVPALVSDITGLQTAEGWLYLAVVLCLRTRQVLGWSMSARLHGSLGLDALQMAVQQHSIPPGTLHHSDRGAQYVGRSFRALLERHGLVSSMSRSGDCYDNAVAESFFATLKRELGQPRPPASRSAARQLVFDYIEVFYNRRRLHSTLGYVTPEVYAKLCSVASSTVH